MDFELVTDQGELRALAAKFAATPGQIQRAAQRTFLVKGQQAEERIKRRIRDQFHVRTGSMMGAIGFDLYTAADGWPVLLVGAIHDPPPHLAVQEYGMTIHGDPWLTVPIEHEDNPMLSQSGGAQTGGAGGVYARDIRDDPEQFGFRSTFVAHGVIFGDPLGSVRPKRGLGGGAGWEIVPIASLKTSVTVPPRPFLRPVWEEIERETVDELEAQVADIIERDGGGEA